MGRINIEIPEDVHRTLKSVCALQGTTIIAYINTAVKEQLIQKKHWKEE